MILSFYRSAIRLGLTLVLLSGQLPAAGWSVPPSAHHVSTEWSTQALAARGDVFQEPLSFTSKAAIVLTTVVISAAGVYGLVYHPRSFLVGLASIGMAIFSLQEPQPSWHVRVITQEEAKPFRAGHTAIVNLQVQKEKLLSRTFRSLRNYLIRNRHAIEYAKVWINPVTFDMGLIGDERPLSPRQKAIHTKNWLSKHSVLLPLWRTTTVRFWETLYQIHQDERQQKEAIRKLLYPYFYFGDFFADWSYAFDNFRASLLVNKIPAKHFYFQLKELYEKVPYDRQPQDSTFWTFLLASEITSFSLVFHFWENSDFMGRRYVVLEALKPLLYRLDEMPLKAKLYLKAIVATYFFQIGKNQIPFLDNPLTPTEFIVRLEQRLERGPLGLLERVLSAQQEFNQEKKSPIARPQNLERFLNSTYTRLSLIWASYFLVLDPTRVDWKLKIALHDKPENPDAIDQLFTYVDDSIAAVDRSRAAFEASKASEKWEAAEMALRKLKEFREELDDLSGNTRRDRGKKGFGPASQSIWSMPLFLTLAASVLATPVVGVIVGIMTLALTLWAWHQGVEERGTPVQRPATLDAFLRYA